ncbi:MAG: TRAP transporter large permease subunit [Spirochaetia bacterium]
MVVNLNIGLATPPVGVCLVVAAPLAETSVERIARAAIPFLLVMVGVLLLITYIPELVMFVPNLVLK